MRFKVNVKEVLERVVEVEAPDISAAISEVQRQYDNLEIILDAEDYKGVYITEEKEGCVC